MPHLINIRWGFLFVPTLSARSLFVISIRSEASVLPRLHPLYALTTSVFVPAWMDTEPTCSKVKVLSLSLATSTSLTQLFADATVRH
jgi:hypothetical protein